PLPPKEIRRFHQSDAVELSLDHLETRAGMDCHQGHGVPTPRQRRAEIQAAVVRTALAGLVVHHEKDAKRVLHRVSGLMPPFAAPGKSRSPARAIRGT